MSRQDSRFIERTVASMETLLASGVSQVPVRHVLQLLGRDVSGPAEVPEAVPVRDPRADPLTDCLPVTAQGGSDADRQEDHGAYTEETRTGRAHTRGGFRG